VLLLKKNISAFPVFTMAIYINLSTEIRAFFAIFNTLACAVLVIIRVYHQKKEKTEIPRISVTGLLCIIAAFLCCLALVNVASDTHFGEDRWCDLSLKLNTLTYSLHRVLLYLFIILRLEVFPSYLISSRITNAGKMVIGVTGIFILVITILATRGVTDNYSRCALVMNNVLMVPFFAIDALVCVVGAGIFVHLLRLSLRNIDRENVSYMLKRTMTWSLVCLTSTLITMLTVVLTDGAGGIVGFDCSITSFSLVMMMSPVKRQIPSKNGNNSTQKASVEGAEITRVV